MRRALAIALAAGVMLGVSGCARIADLASSLSLPAPAETATPAPAPRRVSAARAANRTDVAQAQQVVMEYLDALRALDSTAAAQLMTSYRRAETRAKGWKREVAWWDSARIVATLHPGRYVNDERAFAELYADHFRHPPYQLVVIDVRYALEAGQPLADTDFVVTRDTAGSPWLVHDFGGALRPSISPTQTP